MHTHTRTPANVRWIRWSTESCRVINFNIYQTHVSGLAAVFSKAPNARTTESCMDLLSTRHQSLLSPALLP